MEKGEKNWPVREISSLLRVLNLKMGSLIWKTTNIKRRVRIQHLDLCLPFPASVFWRRIFACGLEEHSWAFPVTLTFKRPSKFKYAYIWNIIGHNVVDGDQMFLLIDLLLILKKCTIYSFTLTLTYNFILGFENKPIVTDPRISTYIRVPVCFGPQQQSLSTRQSNEKSEEEGESDARVASWQRRCFPPSVHSVYITDILITVNILCKCEAAAWQSPHTVSNPQRTDCSGIRKINVCFLSKRVWECFPFWLEVVILLQQVKFRFFAPPLLCITNYLHMTEFNLSLLLKKHSGPNRVGGLGTLTEAAWTEAVHFW